MRRGFFFFYRIDAYFVHKTERNDANRNRTRINDAYETVTSKKRREFRTDFSNGHLMSARLHRYASYLRKSQAPPSLPARGRYQRRRYHAKDPNVTCHTSSAVRSSVSLAVVFRRSQFSVYFFFLFFKIFLSVFSTNSFTDVQIKWSSTPLAKRCRRRFVQTPVSEMVFMLIVTVIAAVSQVALISVFIGECSIVFFADNVSRMDRVAFK